MHLFSLKFLYAFDGADTLIATNNGNFSNMVWQTHWPKKNHSR